MPRGLPRNKPVATKKVLAPAKSEPSHDVSPYGPAFKSGGGIAYWLLTPEAAGELASARAAGTVEVVTTDQNPTPGDRWVLKSSLQPQSEALVLAERDALNTLQLIATGFLEPSVGLEAYKLLRQARK